jgi:hypothetical protein
MKNTHRTLMVAAALLALPLAACGGGGGGGGNGETTLIVPLDYAFSGSMVSFGPFSDPTAGILVVGDEFFDTADYEDRCFLSFSLASLPAGADISAAEIRLGGRVATATNPYVVFGSLLADHLDMGAGVSGNDFTDTLASAVAVLPTFPSGTSFTQGSFPITGSVRDDAQNGRPRASFRLRFPGAPVQDGVFARVHVEVSPADPDLRPTLVITYR